MMKRARARILSVIGAALVASGQTVATADLDASFEKDSVVIETGKAACYEFSVYLALTGEQQMRGLMYLRRLPKFSGMLFVYRDDAPRSMWMKNTFIPLDILFIHADGSIANVAAMTEPLSLSPIPSAEPVRYVLELNGGLAGELGIDTDSLVHFGGR